MENLTKSYRTVTRGNDRYYAEGPHSGKRVGTVRGKGSSKNYTVREVHKDDIRVGDIIIHEGKHRTVSAGDIKGNSGDFMGTTLFGDSYSLGHKKVQRVMYNKPRQLLN